VLNVKISKIYQKNQKKKRLLVMMLHGVFRVHCTFPYMEVLNRKTAKIYRKKWRLLVMTLGGILRVHCIFHIWKMSYAKWKNSKNIEKIRDGW